MQRLRHLTDAGCSGEWFQGKGVSTLSVDYAWSARRQRDGRNGECRIRGSDLLLPLEEDRRMRDPHLGFVSARLAGIYQEYFLG